MSTLGNKTMYFSYHHSKMGGNMNVQFSVGQSHKAY